MFSYLGVLTTHSSSSVFGSSKGLRSAGSAGPNSSGELGTLFDEDKDWFEDIFLTLWAV